MDDNNENQEDYPKPTGGSRFARPEKQSLTGFQSSKSGKKPGTSGKLLLTSLNLSIFTKQTPGPKLEGEKKSTIRGFRSTAPKAASALTIQDVKKKFGSRKPYTIEQLLSLRTKCKTFPHGVEELDGVLQEGIGDVTGDDILGATLKAKHKPEPSARRKINVSQLDAVQKRINSSMDNSPVPEKEDEGPKPPKDPSPGASKDRPPASARPEPAARPPKEPAPAKESGDVEKLKRSENRWVPNRKKTKEERLVGRVKGILNKITFEKFDTLSQDLITFISSKIKTNNQLKKVVSELFAKTVQEKHFGPLYADLCCKLADLTFADEDREGGEVTFKVALVKQCETEFGNVFKPPDLENVPAEEVEMKKLQAKQKALGTVQFIGQLYMKNLLPNKICRVCLNELVQQGGDLRIESAYQFLLTIGKKYDENEKGKSHLDSIFTSFANNMGKNKGIYANLKQRTRILIGIIREVRKDNWNPPVKEEKAKTISEIHDEFAREKGSVRIQGRSGQPTFDEYIADTQTKYARQLKFALSGGCAIRRTGKKQNTQSDAADVMALMLGSSAIVDESQIRNLIDDNDEDESDEEMVTLLEGEEREQAKENLIRTFFGELKDPETSAKAKANFIKVIKKIGWEDKGELVSKLLDSTYDMSELESGPVGEILCELISSGYIPKEVIPERFGEFCEYFTGTEMDAPRLLQYWANMMIHLIRAKIVTINELNDYLKKDSMMDKARKGKDPEFGRRAEFLAYCVKLQPDLTYNAADFLLDGTNEKEWSGHYSI